VNQASCGWKFRERQVISLAVLLVALLSVRTPATASEASEITPTIRSISVGLGGWVKVGKWTPVRVEVAGGISGGRLRLVLATSDPTQRVAAFVSSEARIQDGHRTGLIGWFQPGRLGDELRVSIELEGLEVDRRTVSMSRAPQVPYSWRLRIGDREISSGVDRVEIPVRAGQVIEFINGDPHRAHGLVISGGPVAGLRETTGTVGRLIDPSSGPSEQSVVARYEVTADLSGPIEFHGLATGWVLSGRFVPADPGMAEDSDVSRVIEVTIEGHPVVLAQSESLWVSWGGAAGMDVTGVERALEFRPESVVRAIAWSGRSRRLERIIDLDSVDAIVMAAGSGYAIDSSDSLLLSEWVSAGGHLVVSVGLERSKWLASPMSSWVPIRVSGERLVSDSDLRGLETLSLASERIPFQGRVGGTVLDMPDGRTRVVSLGGPLIGEVAYGFGRVTMLAVDIDRKPLARWIDLPQLVRRLVEGAGSDDSAAAEGGRSGDRVGRALSYSGISDLKTQLHGVQDEFPSVKRPSVWQVFLLVIAVLLLVGPVDYWVVRHVLKRPRATWVTLPLIILATAGLAVWSGRVAGGDLVLVNQLDVLDIDMQTGRVVGRSWATIYSGRSRRLRIEARAPGWLASRSAGDVAGDVAGDCRVVWSGVPEVTFGGMHRSGRRGVAGVDYRVVTGSEETAIEDLPVAVSSTRSLAAGWSRSVGQADGRALVSVKLESSGAGQLSGELRHELPGSIDDWLIAFGSRVYLPRSVDRRRVSWPSGTTLELESADIRNESLKRYLTRTTTRTVARRGSFGTDVLTVGGQYEPLSRNPADWIETVTFHSAAGGTGFTGLENHDLTAMDLSKLVKLNRAVLIGRLVDPAVLDGGSESGVGTELLIEGASGPSQAASRGRRVTYVRIVLPVTSRRLRPNVKFVDPDEDLPE